MKENAFFTSQTVWLTPISPLHVGCGEEFEPTNYVLRDWILYAFEPGLIALDESERNGLLRAARTGLTELAIFFDSHAEDCMKAARTALPVDQEVMDRHRRLLDRSRQLGQGEIFRTAYVRDGDFDIPFVPGSAVKGAVHTALLDKVNAGRKVDGAKIFDADRLIFGGTFDSSPMRALKVGDFMPEVAPPRRVVMAQRMHKAVSEEKRSSIPSAFEIVAAGTYRAFRSEWSLVEPKVLTAHSVDVKKPMASIREIAQILNQRNRPILRKEMEQLSVAGKSRQWLASMSELMKALSADLDAGRAALVRIGKNQGAKSLVLSGGIAQIEIRAGKNKGAKQSHASTQWFVTDNGAVQPFGWCVLEFGCEAAALKAWCGKQRKVNVLDLREAREARLAKAARLEEQAKARAERRAIEEAEARKAAERLNAMSPEERQTEAVAAKLEKFAGAVKPGSDLFREVWDFLAQAEGWSADAQKTCAERLAPLIKKREMYQGKYEKLLKQQLRKLRGEG